MTDTQDRQRQRQNVERFTVTFETRHEPAWWLIPADVRLRRLLKSASRSYGLRAAAVRREAAP